MNTAQRLADAHAQQYLSDAAFQNIQQWLSEPKYAEYAEELEHLVTAGEWQQLEDSFFKVVPFGTGGRRGTVGIGSNRINNVTIGESAQGLAQYLLAQNPDAKQAGVVIGYDTRLTSVAFAELTASIFAANGILVYLFDGFRATPELSFAIRHLRAAAGVVISASHNPPPDNGFKAYWQDGGQVVSPHDTGIMAEVAKVTAIARADFKDAVAQQQVKLIGRDVDQAYANAVMAESLTTSRSAKIAYSPLHGSGSRSVLPVLTAAGFADLTVITEQAEPDGHFPNIKNNIPNPEVRDTSEQVTATAQELGADIAITTDPDADRLGVVAKASDGSYQFLNGNQIAALLGFHVLSQLQAQSKLRPEHFIVKTIVTTDFLRAMATDFGVKIYDDILIGFKYVAELIREHEGQAEFLFGGEESHGILKGTYTRDKDAAVAALLMAELASNLKDQGKTVIDQLHDLYRRYGVYTETLHNIQYPGAQGSQTMATLMAGLRTASPATIGKWQVERVVDRLAPDTPGTKGDVLIFNLSSDGQTRVTVRPSGTEPKLKLYVQVHTPLTPSASDDELVSALTQGEHTASELTAAMTALFEQILARSDAA